MGRSPVLYLVPREIWLLVDHIYRHGIKQKNLFECSSSKSKLIEIRDWLDYGSPEPARKLFLKNILQFLAKLKNDY